MGITVSNELKPLQELGQLREGDVFVAHVAPDGRLVGMIAGDETRRLILILGSEGTALDHQQVGWFFPDHIGTEAAYKIEGARLEIARNARGYAEPVKEPENGCVVVDTSGVAWIRTIDQNTHVSFNLATGVAGSPAGQVCYYRDWQLVWTPPGETEPVVLLRHKGAPATP